MTAVMYVMLPVLLLNFAGGGVVYGKEMGKPTTWERKFGAKAPEINSCIFQRRGRPGTPEEREYQ